jgi:hypothetical protein
MTQPSNQDPKPDLCLSIELYRKRLREFLSGELPDEKLRDFMTRDAGFKNYLEGLAKTERQLGVSLAETKSHEAEPMEPPAWALEGLRAAVKRASPRQSPQSPLLSLHCLKRIALGALALVVAGVVVIWSLNQGEESESPSLVSISKIPIDTFLAQAGPPLVVRGSTPLVYSPSGLTTQVDPVLLLSPALQQSEFSVQVTFPNEPSLPTSEGKWRKGGSIRALGVGTSPRPSFKPGQIAQVRVISEGAVVAEQVFKFADSLDWSKKRTDIGNLSAAAEALDANPIRAGDALAFLAQCSPKAQSSEAGLRLKYLAMLRIGDVDAATELRKQLERK